MAVSIRHSLVMGFWVTLFALLIGYPLAYRLVTMRRTPARVLLSGFLILLWTSVLVKTYAWMAIFAVLPSRISPIMMTSGS